MSFADFRTIDQQRNDRFQPYLFVYASVSKVTLTQVGGPKNNKATESGRIELISLVLKLALSGQMRMRGAVFV